MRDNGIRRAAVFATSAWGGYSSCTQYVEDIARARTAAGDGASELVKLRQYYDHPLFVEMFTEAIGAAAQTVPDGARLVFTAHSIPLAARSRCGPDLYSRQVAHSSRLVATAAGYDDYDQVWQSRSGPPQVPWLEPDVADHLTALAEGGTKAVIVLPDRLPSPITSRSCGDLDYELPAAGGGTRHRVRAGGDAERRSAVRGAGCRSDR
jgi:ferrochelatase